jgi:methenyltetrahydromethanopterin cyclohydrolase
MFSLNKGSYEITRLMEAEAEFLNISVEKLACGAKVIDAGINVAGSYEAGRLFSEVCMGGLGKVSISKVDYPNFSLPAINVTVSQPVKACMAAQYAGWFVKVESENKKAYQAMGSGPARSLYGKEPLLQKLGIVEEADVAILTLESHKIPDDDVAVWVANKCKVSPERVVILVAPTASLVGSIQIASRVVETGMHKMFEVGFDINSIVAASGVCPIAPVAPDNMKAIGWTNDTVLYGGQAWYTAKADPETIEKVIKNLPSMASPDYGTPFHEIFERYEYDFYKIDPLLFSPAEVYINELTSGRTFHAGGVNSEIFGKTFFA